MLGNFLVAAQLAASQEGLSSMELVTLFLSLELQTWRQCEILRLYPINLTYAA
jgi:hypothetical protein